jgi:hypothetical protein
MIVRRSSPRRTTNASAASASVRATGSSVETMSAAIFRRAFCRSISSNASRPTAAGSIEATTPSRSPGAIVRWKTPWEKRSSSAGSPRSRSIAYSKR